MYYRVVVQIDLSVSPSHVPQPGTPFLFSTSSSFLMSCPSCLASRHFHLIWTYKTQKLRQQAIDLFRGVCAIRLHRYSQLAIGWVNTTWKEEEREEKRTGGRDIFSPLFSSFLFHLLSILNYVRYVTDGERKETRHRPKESRFQRKMRSR